MVFSSQPSVAELRSSARIEALENELYDVKMLLKESEALCEKQSHEIESLRQTVKELSSFAQSTTTSGSASIPPPPPLPRSAPSATVVDSETAQQLIRKLPGHRRNSIILGVQQHMTENAPPGPAISLSDRAQSTLLGIRMERNEQLKRHQTAVIKKNCNSTRHAIAELRNSLQILRSEFTSQTARGEEIVRDGTNTLQAYVAFTAAPKTHPPVTADHPVAELISQLCNGVDRVLEALKYQWATLGCFSQGPMPEITAVRRFLDPVRNLTNYAELVAQIRRRVDFVTNVNTVYSRLRFPNILQSTRVSIFQVNAGFEEKLESLFSAMRLIRSPFSTSHQSLSLALRIAATVDLSRTEVTAVQSRFDELASAHAKRIMQYTVRLITLGRRFNAALYGRQEERLARLDDRNGDVLGEIVTYKFSNSCGVCSSCGVTSSCEDCGILAGSSGALQIILTTRRALLEEFTAARLQHFHTLSSLADDLMAILHRYKLVAPVIRQRKQTNLASAISTEILVSRGMKLLRGSLSVTREDKEAMDKHKQLMEKAHTARRIFSAPKQNATSADDVDWSAAVPMGDVVVGPFGETTFSSEYYFRSRRLYAAQQRERRVLTKNYDAMLDEATKTMPSPAKSLLGTSLFALSPQPPPPLAITDKGGSCKKDVQLRQTLSASPRKPLSESRSLQIPQNSAGRSMSAR